MERICLEYVWVGGNNELRSKTKVFEKPNTTNINLDALPIWNFDGSSTGQACGEDSEIILKPVKIFNDPFRENGNIVLCDTYLPNGENHPTNNRFQANIIFSKDLEEKPWFGLEQEYFMIDNNTGMPIGFCKNLVAKPQGQYYCSSGADNAFGRNIAEEHLQSCIKAGIKISGINAEVAPGQWEFQIGPCEGIEEGDHMWTARYLLIRIAEKYNVSINFEPKPLKGDWNGSGCHTNFSTLKMREGDHHNNGLHYIDEAIHRLSLKHKEHMDVYGTGNEERMTGKHETASYDRFSDGIANRGCSIRRGNQTYNDKQGYFEDRRPSSNCDPYLVTSKIFETCTN
jgi:glutamine synthetase